MPGVFRPPPLFAEPAIDIAPSLADKCVRAFLVQFGLKGFDRRNQDLSVDLRLFYNRDPHASVLKRALSLLRGN